MSVQIKYTATPAGHLATCPKYGAYVGSGETKDDAEADLMAMLSALSPVYLDEMRASEQG